MKSCTITTTLGVVDVRNPNDQAWVYGGSHVVIYSLTLISSINDKTNDRGDSPSTISASTHFLQNVSQKT